MRREHLVEGTYEVPADLVVLAVGMRQSPENLLLLDLLEVRQGTAGFPGPRTEASSEGIFLAGSAEGPLNIPTTIFNARSCALAVHEHLAARITVAR